MITGATAADVPGRDQVGAAALPMQINQLLPPGFRAPGYFMNGVPVDPDITEWDLVQMMRPRKLVVAYSCNLSQLTVTELLTSLHEYIAKLFDYVSE